MRYSLVILIICSSITIPNDNASVYNPCNEKQFIELKDKNIDDMSEREYEFFLQISNACIEYQKNEPIVVDKGMSFIGKSLTWLGWAFCIFLVTKF